MDVQGFRFEDCDVDSLLMVGFSYDTIKCSRYEENFTTDFSMKNIRSINFQYPYIVYTRGSREIWVQDFANKIKVFYFDASIATMENYSKVKPEMTNEFDLGMVLDYQDYYTIGSFKVTSYGNILSSFSRKIMKDELPSSKIKSFYRIRLQNQEKKKIEEAVLLQMKESFFVLSLESNNVKYEIKKQLLKSNVVMFRDRSSLFFWENHGVKIEKMKIPFDPSSSVWLQKVYEADDDLRTVKATLIDGVEYLMVVDEPKYAKILKNEENRLSVYKDYFVDANFAVYNNDNLMRQVKYCNEMIYSGYEGYILQEKGKEKEYKFNSITYNNYSLDSGNIKFPLCSEEFILFALYGEYSADYTRQYAQLLLTPPMNSHRNKQREIDSYYGHEFFLHFDDNYVIQTYGSTYSYIIKVFQLNGELLQTINFNPGQSNQRPWFSQSGEYMVVPTSIPPEEQDNKYIPKKEPDSYSYYTGTDPVGAPTFKVYRFKRSNDYKSSLAESSVQGVSTAPKKLKEIINVDMVKKYDVPHEFLQPGYYGEDYTLFYCFNEVPSKHILHVDNKGNVLFLHFERKLLMINSTNVWDTFKGYIDRYKVESLDSFDIFKFGEESIVFKKQESIF
mmetsp:Transcript_42002/g.48666  ORF Transcript_42002/g.48666 Transcript_42002/m.48666 type:complete len:617 (+) Transcript_42002:157-2007(+)